MPSIRFRAPLLALSDLVSVAVLTLRERRARRGSRQDGEAPGRTPPSSACRPKRPIMHADPPIRPYRDRDSLERLETDVQAQPYRAWLASRTI